MLTDMLTELVEQCSTNGIAATELKDSGTGRTKAVIVFARGEGAELLAAALNEAQAHQEASSTAMLGRMEQEMQA